MAERRRGKNHQVGQIDTATSISDLRPQYCGRSLRNGVICLGLMAVVMAAYVPALRAGFIWDDDSYVTQNTTLRADDGLRRIWTDRGASPQYYPLVFTVFWLEYQLWGLEPFGYHLVNIALHGFNAILLWRLVERLRINGALAAAAVFALHPVAVESVAWITELKNVLSGFFYLLALLCLVRHSGLDELDGRSRHDFRYYLLGLVAYAAALAAKSVTCTLPAAWAILIWWKRGRLGRREIAELGLLLLFGFVAGLNTASMERQEVGAIGSAWSFTLIERLLIAGRAAFSYLASLIWPVRLAFIHPRWTIDANQPLQYAFPIFLVLIFLSLWALRRKTGRGGLAAAAYFFATISPALGFFNLYFMRYSFVADHFQYLAMIGPIVGVVASIEYCLRRRNGLTRIGVGCVVLCSLAVLTWRQCLIYKDVETLWRDTLRKNPNCAMAHNNLSVWMASQGRFIEAQHHAQAALAIRPLDPEDLVNLGIALDGQGRTAEAADIQLRAIQQAPSYSLAHYNLGIVLFKLGRPADAEAAYREAIRHRPRFAEAWINLAVALNAQQRNEAALDACRTALEITPEDPDAFCVLAAIHLDAGRRPEAIAALRNALRISPNHAVANTMLKGQLSITPVRP